MSNDDMVSGLAGAIERARPLLGDEAADQLRSLAMDLIEARGLPPALLEHFDPDLDDFHTADSSP